MYEKKYSPIEIRDILSNIIISEKGKKGVSFSVENLSIANGYTRLHTSTIGVHVEFTLKQIYLPVLYFSTQGNPRFFIWHPDNHPAVDILQPRGIIEGTSFSPDNFYIDPKDLFVDGLKVMKQQL